MEDLNKYKELGMDAYLKAKRRVINNSIIEVEVAPQVEEEIVVQEPKKTKNKKEND
jgi:hypothetical protein